MAFQRKILPGISKLIDQLKLSMLPRGTVCWFYLTEVPYGWRLCDGTNGTPNLIGRYAVGSISNIGQEVAAGLPNITGTFGTLAYQKIATGAFKQLVANVYPIEHSGNSKGQSVSFDASRSSSVYGKSATVTPPSTKLLPCMKL